MLEFAKPELTELKPRIAVIGVGGAGCNAVANMIAADLMGVEFVVANTDAQQLAMSPAGTRIQLGMKITPGLGAGASYGSLGHAVVERASADAAVAAHAAGAGSAQLYDTYHPGVCDPMPGWKVTWNPPDCSTQQTPDVRGLMPPAAWTQTEALAPVGLAVAPADAAQVRCGRVGVSLPRAF